jgi:uncharacterized protein YndB with AHSA1/START domain
MPTNKDFKKLIRARMEKTGEAYTAARAQLLRASTGASRSAAAVSIAPPPPAAAPDYAKLAGMSDAAIKKATGCTWEKWVWALDQAGAESWSHRAIADYVHTSYKVRDWWTQTVTVGYERIKGLRAIGQRRGGGFEATKSRTIAASAKAVTKAFTDSRIRRKWLPDVTVTIRTATPGKSVRMTWDDDSSVEVWLTEKAGKTSTAVAHRKLAGKEDADRRKAYWHERLGALKNLLEA